MLKLARMGGLGLRLRHTRRDDALSLQGTELAILSNLSAMARVISFIGAGGDPADHGLCRAVTARNHIGQHATRVDQAVIISFRLD